MIRVRIHRFELCYPHSVSWDFLNEPEHKPHTLLARFKFSIDDEPQQGGVLVRSESGKPRLVLAEGLPEDPRWNELLPILTRKVLARAVRVEPGR